MSSLPFNPVPDTSSAEQNIQLQPSTYQTGSTEPTPPDTTSAPTTSHSSSGSQSASGDNVTLSLNAQAKQLSQQGMSASDIAQALGSTVAMVDSFLNITPTTPPTSSNSSTTAASNITL